jgi:hypothetical protein
MRDSSGRLEAFRLRAQPGWRPRAGVPPPWNLRRLGSCFLAAAGAVRQWPVSSL